MKPDGDLQKACGLIHSFNEVCAYHIRLYQVQCDWWFQLDKHVKDLTTKQACLLQGMQNKLKGKPRMGEIFVLSSVNVYDSLRKWCFLIYFIPLSLT